MMADSNTNQVPLSGLKYHVWVDAFGYFLSGIAGYSAFAADHPHLAVDMFAVAAGLFALANYLASKGD
jgi:hypothetical protein